MEFSLTPSLVFEKWSSGGACHPRNHDTCQPYGVTNGRPPLLVDLQTGHPWEGPGTGSVCQHLSSVQLRRRFLRCPTPRAARAVRAAGATCDPATCLADRERCDVVCFVRNGLGQWVFTHAIAHSCARFPSLFANLGAPSEIGLRLLQQEKRANLRHDMPRHPNMETSEAFSLCGFISVFRDLQGFKQLFVRAPNRLKCGPLWQLGARSTPHGRNRSDRPSLDLKGGFQGASTGGSVRWSLRFSLRANSGSPDRFRGGSSCGAMKCG